MPVESCPEYFVDLNRLNQTHETVLLEKCMLCHPNLLLFGLLLDRREAPIIAEVRLEENVEDSCVDVGSEVKSQRTTRS